MSPVSIRSEQRISASRGTGSSDRLTSVYLSLCGHTPQVRTEEGKSIDQVAFAMAAARDADRFERVAAEQRYAFPAAASAAPAEPSASRRKLRVWTPMTSLHDPLMTRVGAVHLIPSLPGEAMGECLSTEHCREILGDTRGSGFGCFALGIAFFWLHVL